MWDCGRLDGHYTVHRIVGYNLSRSSTVAVGVTCELFRDGWGRFMSDVMELPRVITNELGSYCLVDNRTPSLPWESSELISPGPRSCESPSQRLMIFYYSKVEMRDQLGVFETAVDNGVDHGFPPECAKMLRDIVFRTHLDVFCRTFLGDTPARVEPMAVRLQPGERAVWAKPPSERNRLPWNTAVCRDSHSVVTTSLSLRWPGKGWRRWTSPGSRCRACSRTRRPCFEKSSRRCG